MSVDESMGMERTFLSVGAEGVHTQFNNKNISFWGYIASSY